MWKKTRKCFSFSALLFGFLDALFSYPFCCFVVVGWEGRVILLKCFWMLLIIVAVFGAFACVATLLVAKSVTDQSAEDLLVRSGSIAAIGAVATSLMQCYEQHRSHKRKLTLTQQTAALAAAPSAEKAISTSLERRQVIRLLGLVPFYAAVAAIALWHPSWSGAYDQAKYCYESFSTIAFYLLLAAAYDKTATLPRHFHSSWPAIAERARESGPCCCCAESKSCFWRLVSRPIFPNIAEALLSLYFIANPVLLLVAIVVGIQHGGSSLTDTNFINFCRLAFLIPSLLPLLAVLFCVSRDVPHRAVGKKFIVIKIIVFLGIWQRLILVGLESKGKISSTFRLNPATAAEVVHAFLTCYVSFLLSLLNVSVFGLDSTAVEYSCPYGSDSNYLCDFNDIKATVAQLCCCNKPKSQGSSAA